jgi:DNA-binding response OmpR family regulator/DnaJ-domain-containing protein 1
LSRSDTVNVLIVDDDRATQRMLADALTKQGFTVTVERDGEWAVKTFEKKSFDAVLLDLLLPALNGYEVARKMRSLPKGKRIPIIMISGVYKNALHQKEAVNKHGAYAFLEKPMRLSLLYETLKEALGAKYPRPKAPVPPPPPVEDEVTGEHMAGDDARDEKTQVEADVRQHSHSSFQSIRGDLKQKSFPEVLAEIYRWKGSGALLLRRNSVKKIVYFREGLAQSVKSNLLSECLGRVMIREKMISEAECESSLKRSKTGGRMQGTVLIEMGCISPHNLQYALQLQLQTKIFDAFSWDSGEYQFNPKVAAPPETVQLGLTPAQVIYEGIKKNYDQARLKLALGDVDGKYVHPSNEPLYALQDAGLGEEEQRLIAQADGHKKVSTLRALDLLPPMETDRLFFAMKCAQMIELRDKPAEGKPRPSLAMMAATISSKPSVPAVASQLPPPLPPARSSPPPLPVRDAILGSTPGRPAVVKESALPMPWEDAKVSETLVPMPARKKTGTLAPPVPTPPSTPVADKKSSSPRRPERSVMARSGSLLPELSAVVSAGKLTGEESVMRERLAGKVAAMRKLDYFEILALPTTATREDVKRAYFALAKEYHPDKHFGSSSAEVRQLAQQIYDLISSAHDTLTDPIERERYVKELAQGMKREIGDEVGKILAAEGKFQKGEEKMRQRDYEGAWQLFREAITLYPEEGEFHAWLGWSKFQLDPKNGSMVGEALQAIEHAIELNPKVDKSYLFAGYIQKAIGRPDKAEKNFEKAIQANPDCTEALRELRLLGKSKR